MANCYDIGDVVILKNGTFLNGAGVAVDPPIIKVEVRDATGAQTTYEYGVDTELERLATGAYRLTIAPDIPGKWRYKWIAEDTTNPVTAALKGAEESAFQVKWSPFA